MCACLSCPACQTVMVVSLLSDKGQGPLPDPLTYFFARHSCLLRTVHYTRVQIAPLVWSQAGFVPATMGTFGLVLARATLSLKGNAPWIHWLPLWPRVKVKWPLRDHCNQEHDQNKMHNKVYIFTLFPQNNFPGRVSFETECRTVDLENWCCGEVLISLIVGQPTISRTRHIGPISKPVKVKYD